MDEGQDSSDEKSTLQCDNYTKTENRVKPEHPAILNKDDTEKENKDNLGVKVKRKGRRGRSSGSLTMKGDKITSFTTERGITYAPNGNFYFKAL
ncbi:hypothetical protein ACF0H5_019922 [Mactra antiquata]